MGKRGGNRPRAGKEVDDASYAVTEEEVREFLRSEAGRDPGVVDRFKAARGRATVDHRPRIREIFDDAVNENIHAESFNDMEIDLSPVLDEAASLEERAYHAEAGRLYRNISEVIGEYMPGFDRWEGDYRDIFGRCVDAAARCARAGGGQDAWREWVSYTVGRFLDAAKYKDDDYGGWKYRTSRVDTIYKRSLERECRKKADLEYWLSELGRQSASGNGVGPRSAPVLLMKAHVAGRLGGPAGRDRQLASGYKDSAEACAAYARRLRKTSPREARQVAAYGARKFPDSRAVQSLALSLCPKSSLVYRTALRRMFVMTGTWKYLDELKRRSERWTADRSAVIGDLKHDSQLLARVLKAEGMADALAKVVFASEWPELLEKYHASLATPRHGARLFDEYKRDVEGIMAKSSPSGHYAAVARCLRRMRSIPGQERKFGRYIGQLRERYARRRALMSRLDKL